MRHGTVLGSTSSASWIEVSEQIIVLSGESGTRLPNAVISPGRYARSVESVTVGRGGIALPGRRIAITRWWQSRPTLPHARASLVRDAVERCTRLVPPVADAGIGGRLARHKAVDVLQAARGLLGRGGGLTPEGDDVLVGALAAYQLVGAAIGGAPEPLMDDVGEALLREARRRTTRLSASLISHALNGEVPMPLADLLRAMTGRGSLLLALLALDRVGHSSGRAMAHGAVCGAGAALEAAA